MHGHKTCIIFELLSTNQRPSNDQLIIYQAIQEEENYTQEEEEEEERLLWQINNNTMLYMISFATETPIKTCNMSLAWEPPYNIMI